MDAHLKELVSKGLVAFAYRVVGTVLVFALQIVLARKIGAYEFGLYSLCITLTMLLSNFARVGLDLGIVRKVAVSVATGRPEEANAWFTRSMQAVLLVGCLISLPVYLSSAWLARHVYQDAALSGPLGIFALAIPVVASMLMVAEGLKGLKNIASSAMVQNIIVPLVLLIVLLAVPIHYTSQIVAIVYFCASCIALAYGFHIWKTMIGSRVFSKISIPEVVRYGWPFFLGNIGSVILIWSDTIIVGIVDDIQATGSYYAASKLATLTSFILIAINAISAPKFSALHALGDHAGLARLARQSTAIMIVLASVPILLIAAFPVFWLDYFGTGFDAGRFPLLMLTAGQAVNVACGSVGLLLAMTGFVGSMSRIYLISAVITLSLSFLLGVQWGADGVAIATALGMALWNIWMLLEVRSKLGFWTIPLSGVGSSR